MATTNWGNPRRLSQKWLVAALLGALLGLAPVCAAEEPAGPSAPARAAQAAFLAAQARCRADTNDLGAAWRFGQACFDWAEFATNDTQRAAIAQEGIAVCRRVVDGQPELAAGHYYLGMNLGQLARTKSLGALRLVDEMERVFRQARRLDAAFDRAGPDRNLGLLYLDAPGWPASLGSRSKARDHLRQAVTLCADYPENHLNLLEAALRFGDRQTIKLELATFIELLPAARTNFSGADWTLAWADWEKRWAAILAKTRGQAR